MQDNEHPVITLDAGGAITGVKPQNQVDRTNDILHAVHLFCLTPDGKLLLSRVPDLNEPQILADGAWSTSAATLVRDDEDRDDAALRILADDIGYADGDPVYLRDTLDRGKDDVLRLHSSYYALLPFERPPTGDDASEYLAVDPAQLDSLLRDPDALSPWCVALLEHHRADLPF